MANSKAKKTTKNEEKIIEFFGKREKRPGANAKSNSRKDAGALKSGACSYLIMQEIRLGEAKRQMTTQNNTKSHRCFS